MNKKRGDLLNQSEKVGLTTKPQKSGSIIIPLEEFSLTLPMEQQQIIKEYMMGQMPDLFVVRGFNDDIESTVAVLNVPRPVRILTALYEVKWQVKHKPEIPN